MKRFRVIFPLALFLISVAALAQEKPQQTPGVMESTKQDTSLSQLPVEPATKEQIETKVSTKNWITWGIALFTALIALAALVFAARLARKKKEAELRAEYEFKKRTELEERLSKVEEHLTLRAADRQFDDDQEQLKKNQRLKTEEGRYRHLLETEVCQIHLAAPGVEAVPVSMDEAFVHLNISEHYRTEDFPKLGELGRVSKEQKDLTPGEVMRRAFGEFKHKLLLIIGDPGSGKTTLLKYYALCCLKMDGHSRLGFAESVFPFFLPLRELNPSQSLTENLCNWANQRLEEPISSYEFRVWLEKRNTLILLDGLDEISTTKSRQEICQWIDQKCAGLERGHFVVTSRSTGIRGNLALKTAHLHAEVHDFSTGQKQEFLHKWFRAANLGGSRPLKHETETDWRQRQLREAEKNAEEVIDYLQQKENRSLNELAGIPMLLQLMALIWKQYQTKPKSRTKLYDIALDYLLEYRDDQRGLKPLLSADNARRVLLPVSLWMQEELGIDEVDKTEMHNYIKPILEPIDNALTSAALCANLRDRAAIIADYGKSDYIFRHKSFREYFAGLQLLNCYNDADHLERLVFTFGGSWWSETLAYFLSKTNGNGFTAFMTAFFNSTTSRQLSQQQQNLLQAIVRDAPEKPIEAFLDCLEDKTKNENQQRYALDCLKTIGGERVRNSLESYLRKRSGEPGTMAYAAEIVAGLASPGVIELSKRVEPELFGELPASFLNPLEYNAEYVLIPGGSFRYSVSKQPEPVPDLYFAKYPLTNKRYRRFISYLRGEEPAINKQVQLTLFGEKLFEFADGIPKYSDYLGSDVKNWAEKLQSRHDDDRKFNGDDQPVVSVSWFAARAYCFWLALFEATQHENGLPAGAGRQQSVEKIAGIYRLPHEMEWGRAAAGLANEKDAPRTYPWGKDDPTDKLANFGGNVGATTPVGRYPDGATPEGLMDMAGNVWEWQENLFGDKDLPDARSLRGGSWINIPESLACAFRFRINPDYRYNVIGFRVVRPQSVFDTL